MTCADVFRCLKGALCDVYPTDRKPDFIQVPAGTRRFGYGEVWYYTGDMNDGKQRFPKEDL
jgi:hypothetical protein